MRRFLFLLCVLLPALTWAGVPLWYEQVSVSDVNTTSTVVLAESSNRAYTLTVANDGTNAIYVNTNGAAATTASLKILAGEAHTFKTGGAYAITVVGLICSAGQTSTARVIASAIK